MNMFDYLESKTPDIKGFETMFPDAPKRKEIKQSNEHKKYLDNLKDKTTVLKYYKQILKNAQEFDEELFKKYHKAYVKISNKNASFLVQMTGLMNSNKSADTKWNEYKNTINKAIDEWNVEYAANPNKKIEKIK